MSALPHANFLICYARQNEWELLKSSSILLSISSWEAAVLKFCQSPPKAAGPQEIKILPVYLLKSQTAKEIPISRPQKTLFKYNFACKSATNPLPVTAVIKLPCRIQERK